MKRFIICFLFAFIFLVGCDFNLGNDNQLSNEEIKESLNKLITAESYEARLHYRLVTEEMEIKVNPLLTYQYYTDDNGVVSRVSYNNKIMEGMGLDRFELIADQRDGKIYLNDTASWYKTSLDDIEQFLGLGVLDNNNQIIDTINEIIIDGIKNFSKAKYIEEIDEGERTLEHYVLEYNMYNILENIYDHINNEYQLNLEDFTSFITSLELDDFVVLLEHFEIDICFDKKTNDIARVELELVNLIKSVYEIMEDDINDLVDDENIDIEKIIDYFEHLEVGLNIYNINKLEEIDIPNKAKNAEELDLEDFLDFDDIIFDDDYYI